MLALITRVADAGREAGIAVSVCGDSAADPLVLPLLIGLGVRTLSVPAARVAAGPFLAGGPGHIGLRGARGERALRASTVAEVWELVPR